MKQDVLIERRATAGPLVALAKAPETVAGLASHVLQTPVNGAIRRHGHCNLVLAGGSTPRAVYERLATCDIDWSRVSVWFGDERCVPPDHPSSNFRMAKESLLSRVPIPASQVHRIRGELPPEQAAAEYAALLADARLDIVLLGMGDDGHTASLFPGGPELDSDERVVVTRSPIPPTDRVSMTLRTINEARFVLFLVSGGAKAARIAEVFEQRRSGNPVLPSARVEPVSRELIWMMDEAAGALLTAA